MRAVPDPDTNARLQAKNPKRYYSDGLNLLHHRQWVEHVRGTFRQYFNAIDVDQPLLGELEDEKQDAEILCLSTRAERCNITQFDNVLCSKASHTAAMTQRKQISRDVIRCDDKDVIFASKKQKYYTSPCTNCISGFMWSQTILKDSSCSVAKIFARVACRKNAPACRS